MSHETYGCGAFSHRGHVRRDTLAATLIAATCINGTSSAFSVASDFCEGIAHGIADSNSDGLTHGIADCSATVSPTASLTT